MFLEELNKALGANRKEMFLIAPGFKQHKIQYLSKFNIQYLDSKGEVFVEKLYADIKANIFSDFNKKYLSAETFRKFCYKNKLKIELEALKDRFVLKSFKSLEENASGLLSMQFQNDVNFLSSFNEFVKGKKIGEVTIDGKILKELKLLFNDINVIGDHPSNYRLILSHMPVKEGTVNVVFKDGAEFEDIQYKIFRSKELFEIVATYKKCDFEIQIILDDDKESVTANLKYNRKGKLQ